MARLEEGTVGIKVLGGLPDGNGLPPLAEKLLDDPAPVFALVEFRVKRELHELDTDSHTLVLKFRQVEPLEGDEAKALRAQLDSVRERRTGQRALLNADGTPEDHESGDPVPAPAEPATVVGDAADVPDFTPPTPIRGAKKAAAGEKPAKP